MPPVIFMLYLCAAHINSAAENNRAMLQSPRGSIGIIAQNSFHRENPEFTNIDTRQTRYYYITYFFTTVAQPIGYKQKSKRIILIIIHAQIGTYKRITSQ